MALPKLMGTGRSGLMAAKAALATTGHNISNANTEGYSRQRVQQSAQVPPATFGKLTVGKGVMLDRTERINDAYLEKQLRDAGRQLAHFEEKDMVLKQAETIFNEMNGEGLNRVMAKFFNEFRKLANDPSNAAIRQSVRESARAMVSDFHRLRESVEQVQEHIDNRIEQSATEVNSLAQEIRDLNLKIRTQMQTGASPNDMLDQRDRALKKLAEYMDIASRTDDYGNLVVDVRGVGPLVVGPSVQEFTVYRSPADSEGKVEGSLDVATSASAQARVTHQIRGGKLGALIEARDKTLSEVLGRLDELALEVTRSVNHIHTQGFTRENAQGVAFFKPLQAKERASKFLSLSDAIENSASNIATAAQPDSPGDNRIAIAISGLQNMRIMDGGKTTMDDYFNSMVSTIGVASSRNHAALNQTKDIQLQMSKMRDRISGVSLDEETTNMLQFQQAFDASAKVIQVADEMLETVLNLKR